MGVNITSVEDSLENIGIKALVYGDAGSGKTVLCASANAPTLIINAESGLRSIQTAIRQGILPEDTMEYLHQVEVKSLADLKEVYNYIKLEKPEYEWIALDSITEIGEVVLKYEMDQTPDPRKAYNKLTIEIDDIFKKFRDLKGYNILMSAKLDRTADGDSGKTTYGPLMPGRKLGPAIPYLFDEVMALRVEQDEEEGTYRVLQCQQDINYRAKSRHGLDVFETPNLAEILSKLVELGYEPVSPSDFEEESDVDEQEEQDEGEGEEQEEEQESDSDEESDDESEEVIAEKKMYWYHSGKEKTLTTGKGDDISALLEDDEVEQITKMKYAKLTES